MIKGLENIDPELKVTVETELRLPPNQRIRNFFRNIVRKKNEYVVRDRIRVRVKIKNTSKKTKPGGIIQMQMRYTNNQVVTLHFSYDIIKPQREVYAQGDKGREYRETDMLADGFCLIYLFSVPMRMFRPGEEPTATDYAADHTLPVSDVKTYYAGWALLLATIGIVIAIINLIWAIISRLTL